MSTPSAQLTDLLLELFTQAELKQLLDRHPEGWRVLRAVPQQVAPAQFAFEVVAALDRRGLIKPALFQLILADRPDKAARITQVATVFLGGAWQPPAERPTPRRDSPDPDWNPVRILHISDLHFRPATDWDRLPVLDALARDVAALRAQGLAPHLVCTTGDVACSGRRDEYLAAERWLRDTLLPAAGLDAESLLVVPGNHDVDRGAVKAVAKAIQSGLVAGKDQQALRDVFSDATQRAPLQARHAEYLAFARRLWPRHPDTPWWGRRFDEGLPAAVHVAGLDTALFAHGEDDARHLLVGEWQVHQCLPDSDDDVDLVLVMGHHPLDWLAPWDGKRVKQLITARTAAYLRGHIHEGDQSARNAGRRKPHLVITAGSAHGDDGSQDRNSTHLLELDPFAGTARVHVRVWSPKNREWVAAAEDYPAHDDVPAGVEELPLRESSRDRRLPPPPPDPPPSDPFAPLRHVVRQRAGVLADVFRRHGGPRALHQVYVEVRVSGDARALAEEAADRPYGPGARQRAKHGLNPAGAPLPGKPFRLETVTDLDHDRWVVLGDPGSGKTTLLRHVALELAEDPSHVPVLLKVSELGEGLAAAVRRLAPTVPFDRALAQGRAVILLDGFDEAVDPDAALREVQRAAIEAAGCTVILASRPVGFHSPGSDWAELLICPLEDDAQEQLLESWVPEASRVQPALQRMRSRPRLRRLAENPLLLTLAGLVLRDGHQVPERRGELYRLAVEILLNRRADPSKAHRRLREPGTALDVLGVVALALHGREGEVYPRDHVLDVLRRDTRRCEEVRQVWGGLEDFLDEVAEVSGLLVPDGPLRLGWHFPHRTFREFLAARALSQDLAVHGVGEIPAEALRGAAREDRQSQVQPAKGALGRVLSDAKQRPATWSEVLALTCGLLPDGGDALVRRVAAEGSRTLVQRVVAEAEGIRGDTVTAVLGLEKGSEHWEARRDVLMDLPALTGDLSVAVRLCWRFVQGTTHGNDLFWARELLCRIGRGEVEGTAGEQSVDDVRREAADLAGRVLDHLPGDRRQQAVAWVRQHRVEVPAGEFLMGSPDDEDGRYGDEGPQHEVHITQDFQVTGVPVTNAIYELFDPEHRADRSDFQGRCRPEEQDDHPVVHVTWYEATMFAAWVGARLPREAEWEYAARAGTDSQYWSGDTEEDLARVGWYDGNSGGHTHPVGQKPPNDWGLHDVHGNVWEWCADPWEGSYEGREGVEVDPAEPLPEGDPSGDGRVFRGGSWDFSARYCRSAYRNRWHPVYRVVFLGFRLVAPPPVGGGS